MSITKKLSHWYKIHIELKKEDKWEKIHEVSFKSEEFNDNFERFIDKQLEGLYGIDRMVIYYDTEKNLKEMKEIKSKNNEYSGSTTEHVDIQYKETNYTQEELEFQRQKFIEKYGDKK